MTFENTSRWMGNSEAYRAETATFLGACSDLFPASDGDFCRIGEDEGKSFSEAGEGRG